MDDKYSDLEYVPPMLNSHKSLTKEKLEEWIAKLHEQMGMPVDLLKREK